VKDSKLFYLVLIGCLKDEKLLGTVGFKSIFTIGPLLQLFENQLKIYPSA